MSDRKPSWTRAWTYLLMMGIGWSGATWIQRHDSNGSADRERRSSGRTAERSRNADETLSQLIAAENASPVDGPSYDELQRTYQSRIKTLRTTLPPATDRADAARKAIESIPSGGYMRYGNQGFYGTQLVNQSLMESLDRRAEVTVRLLQWIEAAPDEALAYADGIENTPDEVEEAVTLWSAAAPTAEVIQKIEKSRHYRGGAYWDGLQKKIGESADIAGLALVREAARKDEGKKQTFGDDPYWDIVSKSWPQEKAHELIPTVVEWKDHRLLTLAIARMKPADLCERLPSLLASHGKMLGAGVPHYVISRQIYANDGMPVEQRMEMIKRVMTELGDPPQEGASPGFVSASEITSQVESRFHGNSTKEAVVSSFRSGYIGAREAERLLLESLPEFSKLSPEAAKSIVHEEMLKADLARTSMFFVQNDPGGRLDWSNRDSAAGSCRATPDEFFAHMQLLLPHLQEKAEAEDAEDEQEEAVYRNREFDRMWTQYSGQWRSSDRFHRWVLELPEGRNRDAALEALAKNIDDSEPAAAAAIRSKISNPRPSE